MNSQNSLPTPIAAEERVSRGRQTRERLLEIACEVFAQKGFQAATTREICEQALSNMAAIHYHFGDKGGLYRAVLLLPMEQFARMTEGFDRLDGTFQDRMRALYRGILDPMLNPEPMFENHLRLHFREMIDPTEVGQEAFEITTLPFVLRVIRLISDELGFEPYNPAQESEPNGDVVNLAFAMIGMAMDFFTSKPCRNVVAPRLLADPKDVETLIERLSGYATGMLAFERNRIQSERSHSAQK